MISLDTYQPSSTLASQLVGTLVVTQHWRTTDQRTVLILTFDDGRTVSLTPNRDGKRFDFAFDPSKASGVQP